MHRLIIALLAAFDALVAAAVGLVAILAPLTVLWAISLGATNWDGLWPAAASVWQLGHHVPQAIEIPLDGLVASAIPAEAGSFTLSLAPLAFLVFTSWFAARSGVRAARAGAWLTGTFAGGFVFTFAAVVIEMTSTSPLVTSDATAAVFFPALAYFIPLLIGAVIGAWIEGDGGIVDALHDLVDQLATDWAEVPALVVRGVGVVLLGFTAISALGVLVATIARGGEVVALYQASGVDAMGAVTIAIATLAYLPMLMVWALSWLAGPGFILGTGASVSPAATHLGVLPGLPPLGLIPNMSATWLLICVLLPVGIGVIAGWMVRSKYAAVLGDHERYTPRIVLVLAIAGISAGIAAVLFALASGSLGPGRMADFGPQIGLSTLALFVEVAIGAAIMLLIPRGDDEDEYEYEDDDDQPDRANEDKPVAKRARGSKTEPADPVVDTEIPAKDAPIALDDAETVPIGDSH